MEVARYSQDRLVIGDYYINPTENIHPESYPGAHFQNISTMLKNVDTSRDKKLLWSMLASMIATLRQKQRPPNKPSQQWQIKLLSNIHLPIYIFNLKSTILTNLTTIKKSKWDEIRMFYLETQQTQIHVIDKLNYQKNEDNIHWTENTANHMIRLWLFYLN